MFDKVIVGVDGRQGGRDAVALALRFAPAEALVLANAYPYERHPGRAALEGFDHLLRDESRGLLERVRDELAPGAELVTLADPSPARALHALAEQRDARLLVVGSCHHGAAGRAVLGDVARATLHGAPCPVAVAPRAADGGGVPVPIRAIGVAFDGSPESRAALAAAQEMALALGARLRLRVVAELPLTSTAAFAYAFDWSALATDVRREAEELLDRAVDELEVETDGDVVVGTAGRDLAAMAEQVDVLVTGSRGWGTLRRVALGSTSDWLVHHAPRPVVVVPRGTHEQPEQPAAAEPATAPA